jgi:hypothetical protein
MYIKRLVPSQLRTLDMRLFKYHLSQVENSQICKLNEQRIEFV